MRAILQNVLGSTRWSFVVISTVVSLVIGFIWFSKFLFGPAYMKAMHMHQDNKGPGMLTPMIWEVISRILYFIGLRWILVTWGRLDFASALPIGVMVWLLYVVSTQMSVIAWSQIKKSAFWIVAGNVLVQTVIAVYIFSVVIN